MLTRNDLHQIRNIVQEEISVEIAPLKKDVGLLRTGVETLKKDVTEIKKDVKKIKVDVKAHANYFDKEQLELKDRVKTIEGQLGISPLTRSILLK